MVIGVGNEFRGDDAAGLLVVQKLKGLQNSFSNKITFYEHNGEGTTLLELWQNADVVFLVDAIYSKEQVGKVYRLDLKAEKLSTEWFYSTHAFNITEAIELGKVLNQLPNQVILYGITANNFNLGAEVSSSVYQAIEIAVTQITAELI